MNKIHVRPFLGLLAVAAISTACLLTKTGFHTLSLHITLAKSLTAGTSHLVHSSVYPDPVTVKKFFVRVSGHLQSGNGEHPSTVIVSVINSKLEGGGKVFRFKMSVDVDADGNFNAVKRYKKNIPAGTLQEIRVEPQGADLASGSELWLCVDVAKRKTEFGPSCEVAGGGGGGARVHRVSVLDNSFDPKRLQISAGDTVRWVLEGVNPNHTTTEMNGTWDSGFVLNATGNFFERTFPFNEDGQTFMYSCITHQGCCDMQGSIQVGENAPDPGDEY